MPRFQPLLRLTNTLHGNRRYRLHTTQLIVLVIIIFLCLTLLAGHYLPDATKNVDFADIIKRHKTDFKDVFVPPIPKPPLHLRSGRILNEHNHSIHLHDQQEILKAKIDRAKIVDTLDAPDLKPKTSTLSSIIEDEIDQTKLNDTNDIGDSEQPFSIENLTQLFGKMSIEKLEKIKSPRFRREKVREVS
ncbi:unnamed protein product [Didymodactylos carnosus]|uniref:Uncharacterized protein n=1 Tax=Didymodactylos carnosus TaxID=1234261 RepID=A0A813VVV1_9BILA|nr:unnamed protein product [Didymodactylos carnosus]CAF0903404.1 unnamed protein product [Didymodactylos carnosus]CAF3630838.1 unnamed protein product [Didymodactylos carnosus]CAF3683663.1 unnamed protein product [Didymodactylos carnosus]